MSPFIAAPGVERVPPPLPPHWTYFHGRLEALETPRGAAEFVIDERLKEETRLIEQLKQDELSDLHAQAQMKQGLREQLQRCNVECSERVRILEARAVQQEIDLEAYLKEVGRNKEAKSLEVEVEVAHLVAHRSCDEARQSFQEEINVIENSLQITRVAQQELSVLRESQEKHSDQLELALQVQVRESMHLDTELTRSEQLIGVLDLQLEEVRTSSCTGENLLSMELSINQSRGNLEELQRQIVATEKERDSLSKDLGHIKQANKLRTQEASDLKRSYQQDRGISIVLSAEIEDVKASLTWPTASESNIIGGSAGNVSYDAARSYEQETSQTMVAAQLRFQQIEVVKEEIASTRLSIDSRNLPVGMQTFNNVDKRTMSSDPSPISQGFSTMSAAGQPFIIDVDLTGNMSSETSSQSETYSP